MAGLFGDLFDFDRDGEMSDLERVVELDFLDSMMQEAGADDEDTEDDEKRELLGEVDLDLDELEYMDEEGRREALEEAGFDSDDFDF